jgi:hypothetical protein
MQNPDTSLKMMSALLKPESRCAMLFTVTALVMGAESCIETTMEMTNRICDRYFPAEQGRAVLSLRKKIA